MKLRLENSRSIVRRLFFVGRNKHKKGVIYMYYRKPILKNLSQGARLEYVRRLRHMNEDDVAEYFGFGGMYPHKTFKSYETNYREPSKERLKDIAELYEVSINSIKKYDFNNPIDVIYSLMWLEEEFPYYEINFDCDSYNKTVYNEIVAKTIKEWQQMKEKRENSEISDDEYLEWKLNFEIEK